MPEDIELEEEKKPGLFKKIFLGVIALLLIFLIISRVGLGPEILHIFAGKLASHELDENLSITLKDGTEIVFNPGTYQELLEYHDRREGKEIKACLLGDKKDNEYLLNDIFFPEIIRNDVFSVTSAPCPDDTLVPLHSHPDNRCLYSSQDAKSHESFKKINPDAISAVMCSKTRFGFYR